MTTQTQRNYSSPNCMLFLQGFTDDSAGEGLPVLSVLTTAQCQIVGYEQILSGGKEFLVNLIQAVNSYTQEILSGISHPHQSETENHLIFLEKIPEKNRHLLIWQENKDSDDNKIELELSTIQLFDLVEALDQCLNDSTTLPDLDLNLKPVSRRYRQAEENIIQQSTPAALGFVSLAVAAIALFFIPNPSEIKDPRLEDKRILEEKMEDLPSNELPSPNSTPQFPVPSN